MLFDGETSLNSSKAKNVLKSQYGLQLYVEARYKRVLAERFIREVKLRSAIALDVHHLKIHQWKNVINEVVTTINAKQKTISTTEQLKQYFLRDTTHHVPQKYETLFRFKKGDKVITDLSREERKRLGFKYSLFYGESMNPILNFITKKLTHSIF